jgi:HK97 family phage portal protein
MGFNTWIKSIFKKEPKNPEKSNGLGYSLLNFSTFTNSDITNLNSTYIAAIRSHSSFGSKIKPRVYRLADDSDSRSTIINHKLNSLLSLEPNHLTNASTFWEKVLSDYFYFNNVFIYPSRNNLGEVENLWLLNPADIDVKVGETNIFYRFTFADQVVNIEDKHIIHIARDIGHLIDVLGKKDKSIDNIIKLIHTNYQGLEQSIKTAGLLRFLISTPTLLREEDKKARAEAFIKNFLNNESMGIAYIDAAQTITQLDTSKGKYVGDTTMAILKNDIYEYLGTNEKIVNATYSEEEFQSYYESTLLPIIIKLEEELSLKLLKKKDIENNIRIKIEINRIQYASLETRVKVAELMQKLPVVIPNMVYDILNLPLIPGGEKEYNFLNYSVNNPVGGSDTPAVGTDTPAIGTDTPAGDNQDKPPKNKGDKEGDNA